MVSVSKTTDNSFLESDLAFHVGKLGRRGIAVPE
jgi:hypothetical protein